MINVYSKSEDELGSLLSNFAHTPFEINGVGFASVEGWWYWYVTGSKYDNLKKLYGWKAKEEGKKYKRKNIKITPDILFKVYLKKIEYNTKIRDMLLSYDGEFDHYYVYNGQRVEVSKWLWTAKLWEKIRDFLKQGEKMNPEDLWVVKYGPKTLDEMVVSDEKKIILKKIIKEIPTTLIAGKPGTGKGTFMDILLKETGCPYLKLNGSIDNSIDDIREKVRKFSTAFDPTSKKIVYFNECDRLSPAAMDSLKDLQESVQHITRFFFLSNDETLRNDIEGAIKSRCGYQINLNDPPGKNIYLRCLEILKKENVKIEDSKELLNLIKKCYPDMRKIIGTLQSNVQDGVLKKITFSTDQDLYAKIFKLMKTSDVDEVRKTIKSSFINYDDLYKYIYEEVVDNPDSIKNPADFMVIIGKYLYQNSVVAIKEINFMAFFVELINNEIL